MPYLHCIIFHSENFSSKGVCRGTGDSQNGTVRVMETQPETAIWRMIEGARRQMGCDGYIQQLQACSVEKKSDLYVTKG